MSRTQTINETLAILGKILPENGFDQLNSDRLEELYKELESKGKDEKSSIADELGFPIRKRSAPRKPKGSEDSDVEKKPGRKTGYSCFPAETEYKDKIQVLIDQAAQNGEKLSKLKAKSQVWSTLSEEEKEPFNNFAAEENKNNGLPEKKSPSPKEPKLTLAQTTEQLKQYKELLQQQGVTDLPEPPPREVKPKKKKDKSPEPSPKEEEPQQLSPPVQELQSLQIGSDSDSDDDDDEHPQSALNHIQWSINLVNTLDPDLDGRKADFMAWLISERPSDFGSNNRNTLYNEEELKEFKKTYDFKNKKKDPTSPWFDFIKNNKN